MRPLSGRVGVGRDRSKRSGRRAGAPGALYINLELVSKPGETRWRVSEWNYAFSVDTSMVNLALGCNPKPAPVQTPPPPPNGQCSSTCSGVPGLPALCHGSYSSVPICLPPGCGSAGLPTCSVTDHLWRECDRRADRCVWPVIVGPVSGKWGVASATSSTSPYAYNNAAETYSSAGVVN